MVHDKASLALLDPADQAAIHRLRVPNMSRLPRFLLPAAIVAALATPLAAQNFSESYTFLKAVRDGDGAKVQQIVNNPSSNAINAREESSGEGALHILVRQRNAGWIAFLLARGARADLQTNDGTTPLGLAAQLGWTEGATQLLARGARVDLANQRGETPLILAVQASHIPVPERLAMIELLLSQGADPARQDSFAGYSALDYARQDRRSPAVLRALEARRARAGGPAIGPTQ
jgi:ankyrin repeat protein